MKRIFFDFVSLIYPNICMACNFSLTKGEECICTKCRYQLPQTNYHLQYDNPLEKYFWGRITVKKVAAYYYFNKGTNVQRLLHRLKYEGRREIGVNIGKLYGHKLKDVDSFKDIDAVIPVPLHPAKQKKRGYNQSESFAEGLADSLQSKVITNCVIRENESDTQTRKNRFYRWENVSGIFKLKNFQDLTEKNLLLVDDVITTGATIEACAQVLSQISGVKINVVTIACA